MAARGRVPDILPGYPSENHRRALTVRAGHPYTDQQKTNWVTPERTRWSEPGELGVTTNWAAKEQGT